MHWGQVISVFIFFSSYPFGGILDTLPLLGFRFIFFCFFTGKQPQIYLSAAEKIDDFFDFHYALVVRWFVSNPTLLDLSLSWGFDKKKSSSKVPVVDTLNL